MRVMNEEKITSDFLAEQRPKNMTEISISPEASASQIAALIFLSFTALCLAAYIVVRLLQVF